MVSYEEPLPRSISLPILVHCLLHNVVCFGKNSSILSKPPNLFWSQGCTIRKYRQPSMSTLSVLYCSAWPKPNPGSPHVLLHKEMLSCITRTDYPLNAFYPPYPFCFTLFLLLEFSSYGQSTLTRFLIFLRQEFFSCDSNFVLVTGIFPLSFDEQNDFL